MSTLLSEIDINDYYLFHMRYGKGAIIVAVKSDPDSCNKINADKYVAQVYASGEGSITATSTPLDPIKSINESGGFIKMSIEVRRRYDGKPSYRPINAIIERIVPVTQVTLEIIKANESA